MTKYLNVFSFKVTYTVTNMLHDFQEWKLYWNPVVPSISDKGKISQHTFLETLRSVVVPDYMVKICYYM